MFRQIRAAASDVMWQIIHPNDRHDARSVLDKFRAEALSHGIPFSVVESSKEATDLLSATAYDLGFVCGWYWLLPSSQVDEYMPPLYGIHHSTLPRFRGGAPVVWALLSGEEAVGSTLFRLTSRMDDGPIAAQVACSVLPEMTISDVLAALEKEWSKNIGLVWQNLVDGSVELAPQDESCATYCAQRRPEDGRIDWRQPANYIHNFIRSQASPYPGAFTTTVNGTRVTIDRSTPFAARYHSTPGQILQRSPSEILVGCGGSTALRVLQVREKGGLALVKGRFLI